MRKLSIYWRVIFLGIKIGLTQKEVSDLDNNYMIYSGPAMHTF